MRDQTTRPTAPAVLGQRIRGRRRKLTLTLKAVAERSGLSVGYLSQVETDKAVPSLGTLAQIAQALEVDLDYFITTPRAATGLSRANERAQFSLPGSTMSYEAISNDYPGSELSSYILMVPPGYVSEVATHEGEEIILVLEGEIEQTLGDETVTMGAGDALHYSGATPHSWANRSDRPARMIWTGTLSVLARKDHKLSTPKPTGETS
ncbi:helix-turn-helix domain-containing protein [Thalassorhabdomicrobium marinisediminis]|uniref:helix-turn-helix domain-containing protein n=1 Tax=Thalassorhabdomicrobium marinisediminis TaxID=2170577 RepID=UPI00248F4B55|nr:cupin domain-containing protein [Thalassorhabdomicrobium marinisediminis]